jgi:hypothetical protein
MIRPTKEERLKIVVSKGMDHLYEKLVYKQSSVVHKLEILGFKVSTASFSNIINDRPVGLPTLSIAAKGIQLLMEKEMDMAFDVILLDYFPKNTPDWVSSIVEEHTDSPSGAAASLILHDGRVSTQQKTAFFANAKKEVIEVGVRLNSFSSYFFSQKETAYRQPMIDLLKRGVNVKGYLLDPNSQEARIYFEDRGRVQSTEKDAIEDIKNVIKKLRAVCAEFEAMNLEGKFEIFLYKHIPYNLFFVVDGGEKEGAQMMVSPYLYGVKRADCPVIQIAKKDNSHVFRKYYESMELFIAGAKKLEKEKEKEQE